MVKSYDYKELKGMNKRSILNTLGEGFNFYPSDVWIYDISRSWWGRKTVLFLVFRDDLLENAELRHYYFKLR
ncbi:hypothetical protein CMU16_17405 [Elizabethkingia anophelis]|nr:hypothetical protein [Elizabethkingia anophelis]